MKRYFLVGLCMLLMISIFTACSSASETSNNESTTSQENHADGWPRTIENQDGSKTELKKKPKKIAVLHFGLSEYLFALGVAPIASTDIDMPKSFATLKPYEKELNKMEDLGQTMSPNLEKLIQLQPDLIIATVEHEKILDNLKKIAPVIIEKENSNWKDTLTYFANIVGEEQKAKEFIQNTEKTISDTKEKLKKYNDKTFVFLRPMQKGSFGIIGSKNFDHYHENGFDLKTPQGYPENWQETSLEGLAKLNPDYIFFQDDIQRSQDAVKQIEKDQVWQNINAVKNGHVYYLDVSLNTGSPLAIELAAKTITENLEKQR